MKLNDPLYAIVSPTGAVLGDPEHPCVCESEPDPADVARAGVLAGCAARVVRVRIVEDAAAAGVEMAADLNGELVDVARRKIESLKAENARLLAEHDAPARRQYARLRSAVLWLSGHAVGTPVPDWVSEAVNEFPHLHDEPR